MSLITCFRCFAQFPPRRLHFKCLHHAAHDQVLGQQPFSIFAWRPQLWYVKPPRRAMCDTCHRFTSCRVCPNCRHELPHYVGRIRQRIVAVTGCEMSGKTLYHWGLLHQLREKLSAQRDTFAAVMFEDELSQQAFQKLDDWVRHRKSVPSATQKFSTIQGKFDPIIVRFLPSDATRRRDHTNLIFYDTAGELINSLRDVEYLRYLAHASGIIYLVDPDDREQSAREGLTAVVAKVRNELRIPLNRRIKKPLAIALTKADVRVFPDVFQQQGRSAILPDHADGVHFWLHSSSARRSRITHTSNVCRDYLQNDLNQHSLIALAENAFQQVRYFAISSLHDGLQGKRIVKTPSPLAVEHPLLWLLDELS